MNKTLFKFLLKRTYPIIIIGFAILFVFFPLPVIFTQVNTHSIAIDSYARIFYTPPTETKLYLATIAIMILSYILPIFIRNTILSKSKCDQILSLPIKKSKLFLTTSVFTYLSLIATWTLMMLFGILFASFRSFPVHYEYYFLYTISMYLISAAAFATSSLFASLANNKLDCWILVIISTIFPILLATGIQSATRYSPSEEIFVSLSPIFASNNLTEFFQNKMIIYPQGYIDYMEQYPGSIDVIFSLGNTLSYISAVVFAIGFFILSYFQNIKFKAEDAGELSNYPYSYKLIIPLLYAIILFDSNIPAMFGDMLTVVFVISYSSICYFVTFFIFNRKIRIDKWMVIFFFVSLLGSVGLSKLLLIS